MKKIMTGRVIVFIATIAQVLAAQNALAAPYDSLLHLDTARLSFLISSQRDYPADGSSDQLVFTGLQRNWRTKVTVNSPIAVGDVRIYFINKEADNLYLNALDNSSGTLKWKKKILASSFSGPVAANGLVYIGSVDGNLYALNGNTGMQEWAFAAEHDLSYCSPASAEGILCFSDGFKVYAVDALTGVQKWNLTISAEKATGLIIKDGFVYLSSWGRGHGAIWALDLKTGATKWAVRTNNYPSRPAVSDEAVIFVDEYALRAVNIKDGSDKWIIQEMNNFLAASYRWLDTVDGHVYFRNESSLRAFSTETGELKWKRDVSDQFDLYSSFFYHIAYPIAIFLKQNNNILALDPKTGKTLWKLTGTDKVITAALNGANLTWATEDGYLSSVSILRSKFAISSGPLLDMTHKFDSEETVLAELEHPFDQPSDYSNSDSRNEIIFSKDSRQALWVNRQGGVVVVNGFGCSITGEEFLSIFGFAFSPGSSRFTYRAYLGRETYQGPSRVAIILGHKDDHLWEWRSEYYSFAWDLVFSPDGKKVAYVASNRANMNPGGITGGGPWFMVVNNIPKASFDAVSYPVFSPDSKRLAYRVGMGSFPIYYGIEGTGEIYHLYSDAKKWKVIVDDIEQKEYELVTDPIFSPDSREVVYAALNKGKWFIVKGDKSEACPGEPRHLQFSPDGQVLAYSVIQGKKASIVVKGKKARSFDWIRDISFSADSKQISYSVGRGEKQAVVTSTTNLTHSRIGNNYDNVSGLVFSPDGKRLAYIANKNGKQISVLDGQEGREYNKIGPLAFSPDSSRIAYRALRDKVWVIVVGNQEVAEHKYVVDPSFSPDGHKIGFGAIKDNKLIWQVIKVASF